LNSTDPGFIELNVSNADILKDGTASEASTGTEWGGRTYMSVANYTAGNMHSLIMFNMSRIPSGVVIDNATLTLYCSAETLEAGESIGIGAHMVFSSFSWIEGSGGNGGNPCNGNEYCWNYKPSNIEYNSTPDSSNSIPDGCAGKNYSFSVISSIVYALSNNYNNISFYLIPNSTNVGAITNDEVRFATKEFASASVRPKLNISYHSVPKVIPLEPLGSSINQSFDVLIKVNASDMQNIANISLSMQILPFQMVLSRE